MPEYQLLCGDCREVLPALLAGSVVRAHGRHFLGIALHSDYCALATARLVKEGRHV